MIMRPISGTPANVARLLSRMFVPFNDHVICCVPRTGRRHENPRSRNMFTGTAGYVYTHAVGVCGEHGVVDPAAVWYVPSGTFGLRTDGAGKGRVDAYTPEFTGNVFAYRPRVSRLNPRISSFQRAVSVALLSGAFSASALPCASFTSLKMTSLTQLYVAATLHRGEK